MKGITYADPAFLWLLVLVPAIITYYIIRQQKTLASIRMPDANAFNNSGKSFRHWLRHVLFALTAAAITLLVIVAARPQKTDRFQDVTTEGIDIILALDISGSMLARDFKANLAES